MLFPRLRALLDGLKPGGEGRSDDHRQPRHALPDAVLEPLPPMPPISPAIRRTRATPRSFSRSIRHGSLADTGAAVRPRDTDHGSQRPPVRGSSTPVLALCPGKRRPDQRPAVLVPNPFYQVYAVAALAAGAEPIYVPADGRDRLSSRLWRRLHREVLDRCRDSLSSVRRRIPRVQWRAMPTWAELLALRRAPTTSSFSLNEVAIRRFLAQWRRPPGRSGGRCRPRTARGLSTPVVQTARTFRALRAGFAATGA